MPSRKQRRRREKLQRHEYEYVIENEEGEEVVVERPPTEGAKDGKTDGKTNVPRDRSGREIPKPSVGRVLRRTAIFGPLILVVVWITSSKDATTASKVFSAIVLLAFFIPFSYMVDVLMYRTMGRRQQRARERRG
jgi:hypothetical protein